MGKSIFSIDTPTVQLISDRDSIPKLFVGSVTVENKEVPSAKKLILDLIPFSRSLM